MESCIMTTDCMTGHKNLVLVKDCLYPLYHGFIYIRHKHNIKHCKHKNEHTPYVVLNEGITEAFTSTTSISASLSTRRMNSLIFFVLMLKPQSFLLKITLGDCSAPALIAASISTRQVCVTRATQVVSQLQG